MGDNHDRVVAVVKGICRRLSGLAEPRAWNFVPYWLDSPLVTPARLVQASIVAWGMAIFE
jgi:hypothetical protein